MTKPDEFAHLSLEAIRGTVRWFDAQGGRVGAGVLVLVLREGGKPGWSARSRVVDEQREYGLRVAGWLNEHFPDLRQPSGWPHPGAVAAVIRLHYEFGKDGLGVVEHGPTIREAVRRFDEKWLSDEGVAA